MIARMWKASASQAGAAQYEEHFRAQVLPALKRVDGCVGGMLLRQTTGPRVELLVISFWRSEAGIRAFAGPDAERAVVAEEAQRVLDSYDEGVAHFTLIAADGVTFG